jgi:hypothetical protein
MRLTSAFAAILLIGGLTACDLIGATAVSSTTENYDPSEYAGEAKTRPIPVTVYGSALGVSGAALTKAVVDDMAGQDWAPHAHFTMATGSEPSGYFSFVMMMNGPANLTAVSLCAHSVAAGTTLSNASDIRVTGALCRYSEAVSEVSARVSGATSLQDAKFADLIATTVRNLTPTSKSDRQGVAEPTN